MNRSFAFAAFGVTALLFLTACSSAVTPEKISQIKPAMKPDEVKAILGQPASIEHAETTGLTGDLYHYPAQNGEGRVVFLNDAVFKAEFVPAGAKS
ncbi:MAG TPA: hypothetical protein VL981_02080 [Candidatus Methylacidiphilales bacterium]|nr:hypothetical protein [Candidatus Methylacidiphilales bacterium]